MSTLIQNIQNRAAAFQNALKAASDVHTHLTGYSYKHTSVGSETQGVPHAPECSCR
jgi:hypothetical protein